MEILSIISAIAGAGLPLVGQLMQLVNLFVKAQQQGLTLPEVEAEILKITNRSASDDAEENERAGIK